MGLFNGLLSPQDTANGAAPNGQPPTQNTPPTQSQTIIDPPITDNSIPNQVAEQSVIEPLPAVKPAEVHRAETSMGGKQDSPNETKLDQLAPAPTPPITPPSEIPSLDDKIPFPAQTQPEPPAQSDSKPIESDPAATLDDLQSQMDVINSFRKNPSVEALVALMYHKDEYMDALKTNTLDQLLENIRKYNPLVRAMHNSNKSS
jgi:hypothetical protein